MCRRWDGSQGNFDAKKSKKDLAAASKKERENEKKFRKALKGEETADKLMKKVKHDTAQLEHTAKESVHKQTHRTKEIEHKKVESIKEVAAQSELNALYLDSYLHTDSLSGYRKLQSKRYRR